MANPENLIGKGFESRPENINRDGRPKKIFSILKEAGYNKDDIRIAFMEMSFSTMEELVSIFKNPDAPVILKVIAHAYKRAVDEGDMNKVADIINQIIGKPAQTLEVSGNITAKQVFKIGNVEIEM